MRFKLDYHNNFNSSLLFWLCRFIRYKFTTLSNTGIEDKRKLHQLIDRFNRNIKNVNELNMICKEARKSGLKGINTYANPLIKLYYYLIPFKFKSLRDIDEECLSDFLVSECSTLSPSSKKNHRIAIIGFFNYIDKQNEDKNGYSYVFNIELKNIGGIRGTSGQKLPSYLDENEFQRFIKAIDKQNDDEINRPRNRFLIRLIAYTGIRVSEAINLKVSDIFYDKDAYLFQIRGKGDKMRVVVIKRKHIKKILDEWLKKREEIGIESDLLICNKNGNPLSQAYIYKLVEKILSYCKIIKDKRGPHMLRHSFATLLYRKSQDLILVQEALGHSNLNTSRIYTHFDRNRLMEAANIIDRIAN